MCEHVCEHVCGHVCVEVCVNMCADTCVVVQADARRYRNVRECGIGDIVEAVQMHMTSQTSWLTA